MPDKTALATQLFTLHRWTGFLVIALVLMHVGAALYHQFIRGDEVLKRMLPERSVWLLIRLFRQEPELVIVGRG